MAAVLKFSQTNIADLTSGKTALQTGLPFPEKGELKQPTGFMSDPQKSKETIFNQKLTVKICIKDEHLWGQL